MSQREPGGWWPYTVSSCRRFPKYPWPTCSAQARGALSPLGPLQVAPCCWALKKGLRTEGNKDKELGCSAASLENSRAAQGGLGADRVEVGRVVVPRDNHNRAIVRADVHRGLDRPPLGSPLDHDVGAGQVGLAGLARLGGACWGAAGHWCENAV